MRTIISKLFLAFIVLLVLIATFFNSVIEAQEIEKTDKVITTGLGLDRDKAKENAIRNAVEYAVGIYVSSDTIVKNSQIIKDEVLGYSAGYIKTSRIIFEEKKDDGIYAVQIEAVVVSTKLARKLESLNIATKTVEGESLFGEATSRITEQRSASSLINKIISKYPQAAYQITVGKPEIVSTNPNTNKATISLPLTIQWDKAFVNELKEVLSQVTIKEFKWVNIMDFYITDTSWKKYPIGQGADYNVVCFARLSTIKSGKAEVCEIISKDSYMTHQSKYDRIENLFNPPSSQGKMSLSIFFKDRDNKIIDASTYKFAREDRDSVQRQGIPIQLYGEGWSALQVVLNGEGFTPPNILWRRLLTSRILILVDGTFKINVPAEIDTQLLEKISSVEVKFDSLEKN